MIVLNAKAKSADLRLSGEELAMLNNALNEICNGVHLADAEFQTRMGYSRERVQHLLAGINKVAQISN